MPKKSEPQGRWVTPITTFTRRSEGVEVEHLPFGPAFLCPVDEAVHLEHEVRLVRAATDEEITAAEAAATSTGS